MSLIKEGNLEEVMKRKKKKDNQYFDKASKRARSNRNRLSKPEIYFDCILRLLGVKYTHQFIVRVPYTFYIVDFYLHEHALAIEIDGPEHQKKELEDRIREEEIRHAIKVDFLRFTNKFVLSHPLEVLLAIKEKLDITEDRLEGMIEELMEAEK